jgi:hypothetical protein
VCRVQFVFPAGLFTQYFINALVVMAALTYDSMEGEEKEMVVTAFAIKGIYSTVGKVHAQVYSGGALKGGGLLWGGMHLEYVARYEKCTPGPYSTGGVGSCFGVACVSCERILPWAFTL